MTSRRQDLLAVLLLIALWLLFFWRLLTPVVADQASLKQGDFSGQFVAFGAYQYSRFSQGEVPLWNPYNNGGLPFIADTQAAVFYPPRLITIAVSGLAGGWSYHALELEMMFHVLAYALLWYALVRRMTMSQPGSHIGALIAAVVGSYGGFMTGYAPLQLAILEAGIWLPLALLGILEATRRARINWAGLLLASAALGLSWLAGHPQTSWLLTYLLVAYLAYRTSQHRLRWWRILAVITFMGLIAGGLAAVQLLPGLEYLPHTARVDFTFDAKGNGFPFKDVLQMLFPGQLSLFSPLYIGVIGLALLLVVPLRRVTDGPFWLIVALVTLGLSFGANSALYPALYNLLPGMRYFRGQERAAYLVVNSLTLLAGLSAAYLISHPEAAQRTAVRRRLLLLLTACVFGIVMSPTGWLSERPDMALSTAVFSTASAFVAWLLIPRLPRSPYIGWMLVLLLAFELFTVNMDADSTYDPVPPTEQLALTPPPLIAAVLDDTDTPFRVDGFRGLTDNYGSLYELADMRGISPLFLSGPFELIEPEKINPLAWELFAVRYVYTDWEQLPVPSQVIASGEDRFGPVNLHRLTEAGPFAQLIYQVAVLDSDAFAYELLRNPDFDPRQTVIVNQPPVLNLATPPEAPGTADVVQFAPEQFTVTIDTPANAMLSLAYPDYPGWEATLDGQPVPILRAYGALTAIEVPAGKHEVMLTYNPLSYRVGSVISGVTVVLVLILAGLFRMRHANIK
jgi:hypothetical protein